jgi:hypothetical protein
MPFSNQDYNKRDCELPAGCKDLVDVIKHDEESALQPADPPITRQVFLPEKVSVKYLAEISGAGIFAISMHASVGVNRSVAFEEAAKILRKYGIEAKRAYPPEPS